MQLIKLGLEDFADPGDQFSFGECIGSGVYGKVYQATDKNAGEKNVAIKLQKIDNDTKKLVEEEYKILKNLCHHLNLPYFYGAYTKGNEIWFVMELCEGGPVIDLVNCLMHKNRRLSEEHIAYILKEVVKALIYLHEKNVIHRDVKASNILLTKEGEVKLSDFGLSKILKSTLGTTKGCLGSPCWMAPEVVSSRTNVNQSDSEYGNRADVWSLGITAIEIADGKAPFQDMHPTRALFQIVTNPPPSFYSPAIWSENFNDFVNECLVKNPEHRPYMVEVIEHPFLEQVPDNNYHLSLEIKKVMSEIDPTDREKRARELTVQENYLKKSIDKKMELMYVEDLAALDKITEDNILKQLECRLNLGEYQTFVGDILLVLNPNEKRNNYGNEVHQKYVCKSRSDNAPHVFSIADSAYQNALHHMIPQRIVLTGECGSGKTQNYLYLIDHLLYLGENKNINLSRVKNAIKLIHSLTHASTPFNTYSTRCILKTDLAYGKTGKVSGANFKVYSLEKWRVSSVDMFQGNFHILYYIYDGLKATEQLEQYKLNPERNYRYLRIVEGHKTRQPKDNIENNVSKYEKIMNYLKSFEFTEDQIETIKLIVSSILILGDVRFQETEDGDSIIENEERVSTVAALLKVESKKFSWALTNYCLIRKGTAIRRKNTCDEARDARDVLANNLYSRLVDYIVSMINEKFAVGMAIFGEQYTIKILDYFGFECFKRNHFPQFLVNCFNEQMQYHYSQRIFSWEALDFNEEEVDFQPFNYYDNKSTLDQLLGKPEGILTLIDDASKRGRSGKYVIEYLQNQSRSRVCVSGPVEFSVAHYTGKVRYDVREMPDKNRDFLPPEIVETLRLSENPIIKTMFFNKLNKTGNLHIVPEETSSKKKYKFDSSKSDKLPSALQYSQIKRIRTVSAVYKAVCLELLKELSVGGGTGGTHFVRCLRTDLEGTPGTFDKEVVKHQLRAMAVVETAKARQRGFPHRIAFPEFLRRYKFLAFDFNETVEISNENCRLLLIRLKMEGWTIGKTKVFLKYYNEEYLARLYETKVKKIIKIQSILRRFLAKCKVAKHIKDQEKEFIYKAKRRESRTKMTEGEAAAIIQKAYRESTTRKAFAEFALDYEILDEEACKFIRPFAKKWRHNSIFHVLLQYRAVKLQEFYSFCQQVHLYGLNVFHQLLQINEKVNLSSVDTKAKVSVWIGDHKPSVLKVPFRLTEIPFYDTSCLSDPLTNIGTSVEKEESWDSPYKWRILVSSKSLEDQNIQTSKSSDSLIDLPFSRDPDEPPKALPKTIEEEEEDTLSKDTKECVNFQKKITKSDTPKATKTLERKPLKEVHSPIQKSEIVEGRFEKPVLKSVKTYNHENLKKSEEYQKVNSNATPANEDFDYIRATPVTNRPKPSVDPIAELRNIGRKGSTTSEDEPPFNFQGMLRKTNFKRDSVKKHFESSVRKLSLTKPPTPILTNDNCVDLEPVVSKKVCEEILPGIFIEGYETDL